MALYRQSLPQLRGTTLLTDGGLETTLVFLDGMELPCFASFPLLESAAGRQRLRDYFAAYLAAAKRHGAGFLLCSPTWRANPDWGAKLGYSATGLAEVNRRSIPSCGSSMKMPPGRSSSKALSGRAATATGQASA
jgi:homocysteine S-methyltransferase